MKLTPTEKTLLKNLDARIDWIARDFDNNLWVYVTKPVLVKDKECIYYTGLDAMKFPYTKLFKFIEAGCEKPFQISKLMEEE